MSEPKSLRDGPGGCDELRHGMGYRKCPACVNEDFVSGRWHQDDLIERIGRENDMATIRNIGNQRWARNIANNNPHQAGGFIQLLSKAYLHADDENQAILDESIAAIREKYPKWDIPERLD